MSKFKKTHSIAHKKPSGFTLVELMIVIAIIGILASVAIPQYADYTRKSKFAEVVGFTASAKTAVSICAQESNGVANCTPGTGPNNHPGIPADIVIPTGFVHSLTTAAGVITAVGTSEVGGHDYVLTPTWTSGIGITWGTSGSCDAAGFCRQ